MSYRWNAGQNLRTGTDQTLPMKDAVKHITTRYSEGGALETLRGQHEELTEIVGRLFEQLAKEKELFTLEQWDVILQGYHHECPAHYQSHTVWEDDEEEPVDDDGYVSIGPDYFDYTETPEDLG